MMRKNVFLVGSMILALTALLFSCNEPEDDTSGSSSVQKYLDVQDGILVKKDKPFSTAEFGLTVNMNSIVIPGGTVIPDVYSPVSPKRMYIGVEDVSGYYEVVPEATDNHYSCVIIINQDLELEDSESFIIWGALTDADGDISETWEKEVSIRNVGTGQLQISLSFNNDKDVDLHLIEPGEDGEHIYYGNRTSDNGGQLDLDSNAGCSIDGVNNENITYGEDAYIAPGVYEVYVDMYSNCDPSIATDYVVTVTYNGRLIGTTTGTNPARGTFPVDEPSNHANLSNLTPVMTFTIGNKGQMKTKSFPKTPHSEMDLEKMSMEE